jgi:hypothetical protein
VAQLLDDIERGLLLKEVSSAIDRVTTVLIDEPAGVASLALLSLAVTSWKKTGLPIEQMYSTIESLLQSTKELEN